MKLPILAGPLRGSWWLPRSGGKLLRILNGSYEPEQTRLFMRHIRPGMTVLDVGAHVGYYTLLSSQLAGAEGRVVAFEPNPRNLTYLRGHVDSNRLHNVTVVPAAVSESTGVARFQHGSGSGTGHLGAGGELEVRTIRLDEICSEQAIEPDAIKIDVEGAELHVLRGAASTIESARPVIFLSTHGVEVHRDCLAWLQARDYAFSAVLGDDVARTTEVLCLPEAAV